MKTIYLVFALVVTLSACKKADEVEPNNAASSARFVNPDNTITTAGTLVVDSVIPIGLGHPAWIAYVNSARYLSLDTELTGGVVDWSYPILLKTYKVNGSTIPYREISYRLYETFTFHNDEPFYRQFIVHAVFNNDSTTKDYAIIIEHFNCLFDMFETYAYWHPNDPFYGSHTYMTVTADTLDQYTMWSDTLKFETYPNISIGYYNTQIAWNDLVGWMDSYHRRIAPIKSWFPISSRPVHLARTWHWYPIIDHIYQPTVKYQLIDVEGALITYLIN